MKPLEIVLLHARHSAAPRAEMLSALPIDVNVAGLQFERDVELQGFA
jgi:hypothetical protein